MARPRRGEIRVGVRVTLLTGGQQIFADDLGILVRGRQNVVHAVTVVADRLVRFVVRRLLLEQFDRGAVEVCHVGIEDIGGTLRLGSYPCVLDKSSKSYEVYGEETIQERHRHRYEVNNYYREELIKHGITLAGVSPDGRIVEMIEIKDHPWFIATQAHPEFKSRPNRPHPLFRGFVEAALKVERWER